MKHILQLVILMLSLACVDVQAQGPSKTCPTCGLSMAKCQYKGKHPKPVPTPTPVEKKCASCGKPLSKCQYNGKHPKITTGKINGHEWVDLGLPSGTKWATCNVGANKPEEFGGYYAWGETSTKSNYDWNNCFDCLDNEGDSWEVYNERGKTHITPDSGHDTARENWGSTWRMPTAVEIEELIDKCSWNWATKNGHKGYTITGPNGNSIFLPAAGCRGGDNTYNLGETGDYYSSTLDKIFSRGARSIYFNNRGRDTIVSDRNFGLSIRPVTD
ncbi:MAG: hypothetical protein Q4E60_07660 [Bacteroidales bacterium]|nr:hypothetical protein [Bacteroidales bacterium]